MTEITTEPISYGIGMIRMPSVENRKGTLKYVVKSVYNIAGKAVVWNDICNTHGEALDKVLKMQKKYTYK